MTLSIFRSQTGVEQARRTVDDVAWSGGRTESLGIARAVAPIGVSYQRARTLLRLRPVDDAFDLLDVLPFMDGQPLRIKQHGPLEGFSRPRDSRRA